jgi:endonuclease/exonuclease/phosphatase family metal-dependent hydrolase
MARKPRRKSRTRRKRTFNQSLAGLLVMAVLALAAYSLKWYQDRAKPPSSIPQTTVNPNSIRIATWNLRQFSDRGKADLRAIASIIEAGRFDLVAIQEVKRDGEQLDRLLNVLGPPWRATLSEMTGNYERFAYLYKGDRIALLTEGSKPDFIPLPYAPVFDRVPYQASFRTGTFDFTLITVHLSYSDSTRRRKEAQALADYAVYLLGQSSEKDIVLLGDFNEQGRGNLHFAEAHGWQKTIKEPTNLNSKEIYDQLLIHPGHTREFIGLSGVIRFDESHYANDDARAREAVSDHRPAYADFATNLPDDD